MIPYNPQMGRYVAQRHYLRRHELEDRIQRLESQVVEQAAHIQRLERALGLRDDNDTPPATPSPVILPEPPPSPKGGHAPVATIQVPEVTDGSPAKFKPGNTHRPLVTAKVVNGAVEVAVANEVTDPVLAEGAEVMRRMLRGERAVNASVLDRDAWRRGERALMHATQCYTEATHAPTG